VIYESKPEVKFPMIETKEPNTKPNLANANTTTIGNTHYVECFLCQGYFTVNKIEKHVNNCLEKNGAIPENSQTNATSARKKEEEENERLFRELMEQEAKALEMTVETKTEVNHNDGFLCSLCQKVNPDYSQLFMLDACSHCYCTTCIHSFILSEWKEKKNSNIICSVNDCGKALFHFELRQLLSDEEWESYEAFSVSELIENNKSFLKCPNPECDEIIEKLPYTGGTTGKSEVEIHKEEHRFRCRQCSTDFCSSCTTVPYHEGFTCAGFTDYQKAKHCRFCEDQLTKNNTAPIHASIKNHKALHDVCTKEECRGRRDQACCKTLACGHFCNGVRNEKNCELCFNEKCCTDSNQSGDSFCNICWVESLQSAPCIKLKCGHIFHYHCVHKQVSSKWSSANVTFGFMDCPLCNTEIEHESLKAILDPMKALKELIKERALKRLQYLKEEKAKEIVEKGGPFYNNPTAYAFKRYCYYLCHTCNKPYYGGERACNAEQRVAQHDPKELICGSCSGVGMKSDGKPCKHGNDYIEWKCKFCCNVAVYFCWGNTHFCEPCHKEAVAVSKRPVDKLPKCTCKVEHPSQGTEYCIGCSMCKLERLFLQDL
jgi:E3 ubiquitin-protein ligase MYCBP2